MRPRTLFQKIWDEHVVIPESEEAPAVLHVDLHLIHEVTSPQAFDTLRARDLKVRHNGIARRRNRDLPRLNPV